MSTLSNAVLITLALAMCLQFVRADTCTDCMCRVESGCKPIGPIGCVMVMGSLSCGYFQITLPYYQDCDMPGKNGGESMEDAWKRCSDDYNCALTCMKNYFNRYKSMCPQFSGCEQRARIHHGGPYGCTRRRQHTDSYWEKIRDCCHCENRQL